MSSCCRGAFLVAFLIFLFPAYVRKNHTGGLILGNALIDVWLFSLKTKHRLFSFT